MEVSLQSPASVLDDRTPSNVAEDGPAAVERDVLQVDRPAPSAVRDIVQAYRRARHAGDQDLTAFNAACTVGLALGRPNDEVQHTVRVLLEWARDNHREWFYRFEPPAAPARETPHPARGEERPAPDAEPLPPRHSPIF
jgi:hypothetical protein